MNNEKVVLKRWKQTPIRESSSGTANPWKFMIHHDQKADRALYLFR